MTETEEVREFVQWFTENRPQHVRSLRVSMSGMNLGGGKKAAIMVKHMRSQGVQPGESDLLIALARGEYHTLVIEHKALDSKHPLSDEQRAYLRYHQDQGNMAVSTKGLAALQTVVQIYMED